jgi:glycosyltransferase 2 family protein
MRKFIFAVVLLLAVVYTIARLAEVQSILETIQRGDVRFLLLALGLQIGALIVSGLTYWSIYHTLGISERISSLILLSAAATFLNIVAPSAGVSGMAAFITRARQERYSPGKAAVAGAIFLLFEYGAFMFVLALGLLALFRRKNLDPGEIFASTVLFSLALFLAVLIYLGMRSKNHLGRALAWMSRKVNRVLRPFIKRDYLSEERAYQFAGEASEGIAAFLHRPSMVLLPGILALARQLLLISVLLMSFLAFKVAVAPGTLIAGYSMGYLFLIVSPTPAGLGIVEGMLTLTLRSLYVPFGSAAVITLVYRGFTFWLPFLFGLFAFRWLGMAAGKAPTELRPAEYNLDYPTTAPENHVPAAFPDETGLDGQNKQR